MHSMHCGMPKVPEVTLDSVKIKSIASSYARRKASNSSVENFIKKKIKFRLNLLEASQVIRRHFWAWLYPTRHLC